MWAEGLPWETTAGQVGRGSSTVQPQRPSKEPHTVSRILGRSWAGLLCPYPRQAPVVPGGKRKPGGVQRGPTYLLEPLRARWRVCKHPRALILALAPQVSGQDLGEPRGEK